MKYFLIITTPTAMNTDYFSSFKEAYATLLYNTFMASIHLPMKDYDPMGDERDEPNIDDIVMPTVEFGDDTSRVAYKNDWANFRIVETEDDVTKYALYYEKNGEKTVCTLYGSIIEARWALEAAVTAIQQSSPDVEWNIDRQENGVVMTTSGEQPQHHAWRVFKLDDNISVLF